MMRCLSVEFSTARPPALTCEAVLVSRFAAGSAIHGFCCADGTGHVVGGAAFVA